MRDALKDAAKEMWTTYCYLPFSLYVDFTLSLSLVLWAFVYDFAFVDLQAGMRNSDKCS